MAKVTKNVYILKIVNKKSFRKKVIHRFVVILPFLTR